MNKINIELTLEEINLVLTGLGNLPYIKVYDIIQNIQQQATCQFNEKNNQFKAEKKLEKIS